MSRVTRVPDAIAEAARWHLLGVLFERPRARRTDLRALAGEVPDPALRAAAELVGAGTEGTYLAALGPGGTCSPREVAYCGLRDPGWVLADVARYYQAFGYLPRAEDPLDHVAVEVGFVAYLQLKAALARERGDEEAAAVTTAAREAFVRGWAPRARATWPRRPTCSPPAWAPASRTPERTPRTTTAGAAGSPEVGPCRTSGRPGHYASWRRPACSPRPRARAPSRGPT
jgi:hypothetical protein